MKSTTLSVEFFYDVVSPYSYLAFEVFHRYMRSGLWDVKMTLRPFFLGGVMHATGNRPPATLPPRAAHLVEDLRRNSEFFQVPLQMPPDFPVNTLSSMRLLTVVARQSPADLERVSRSMWQRSWGRGLSINTPEGMVESCVEAGVSAETARRWLQASAQAETKEALKATTDEAVARGAYGAPTFFIKADGHEEAMYFGSDRFECIAHLYKLPWLGPCPQRKQQAQARL